MEETKKNIILLCSVMNFSFKSLFPQALSLLQQHLQLPPHLIDKNIVQDWLWYQISAL